MIDLLFQNSIYNNVDSQSKQIIDNFLKQITTSSSL